MTHRPRPTGNAFALELRGLRKRLGRSEILCGVDLQVRPGERVAIIGPNGAGKTTLLHLVGGGLRPDRGEIRLNGERIDGLPPHRIRRRGLARSFQVSSLFERLSVADHLRCALLQPLGHGAAVWTFLSRLRDVDAAADALLRRLRLESRRDTPAGELSHADRRALEIGLAVAGGAPVVLLDEPTAGMSRSETQGFVALIRKLTEGRTLLMVEHDMGVVFALADRIAVLVQGQVIAFGTPEAVRADPAVQQAYLGSALAPVAGGGAA